MHTRQFFIDGAWVDPVGTATHDVINPATEEKIATISLAAREDVDRAVAAAKRAFPAYATTSVAERAALLRRIIDAYKARYDDIAKAISQEMGAPIKLAKTAQAAIGSAHFKQALAVLESFAFETNLGTRAIRHEPIGVCAMITPWNWPMNQIACKVAPALATGCTMVLKPSEYSPLSTLIFAEVLEAAGVPKGVFNLINGAGEVAGAAMAAHPDVDMVSFTGSTRGGVAVAKAAADTVKRVHQELGGKSANILLPDVDLKRAATGAAFACFNNTGQSCNAPTRLLVHESQYEEAVGHAVAAAQKLKVGDPADEATGMGPLVNAAQHARVVKLIEQGVKEGARLATGGAARPEGVTRGYFVQPTVFADVRPDMVVAREEIFGPVLVVIPYRDEEQAVAIANDTIYGLAAYVSSGDPEKALAIARRLRAGTVHLNGAMGDVAAPFGGYKQSGNGRDWGKYGFEEYLEVKSILGVAAA